MSRREQRDREFTEFAEAAVTRLLRSAMMLCGDKQKAEDLVQETLAKVYVAWGRKIDNPMAYAHTTLTNTFLSSQRKRSSTERPVAEFYDAAAPGSDPDLRMTLDAALAQLSPTDRSIVVMRYLQDVPVESVGEQVGLSGVAVRSRAHRALHTLREQLGLPMTDLLTDSGA